ncbi:MAG: hypothetical protein ABUJ92_00635 [Desulfobacterales bacterium]
MSNEHDGRNQREIAAAEKGAADSFDDWICSDEAAEVMRDQYVLVAESLKIMLRSLSAADELGRRLSQAAAWCNFDCAMDDAYQNYVNKWVEVNS